MSPNSFPITTTSATHGGELVFGLSEIINNFREDLLEDPFFYRAEAAFAVVVAASFYYQYMKP